MSVCASMPSPPNAYARPPYRIREAAVYQDAHKGNAYGVTDNWGESHEEERQRDGQRPIGQPISSGPPKSPHGTPKSRGWGIETPSRVKVGSHQMPRWCPGTLEEAIRRYSAGHTARFRRPRGQLPQRTLDGTTRRNYPVRSTSPENAVRNHSPYSVPGAGG